MKKFNIDAINNIEEKTTTNENIVMVNIEDLKPNPYQPRLKEENLEELANSINEDGLIQAITINEDFVIVAGHRRYYAHKFLKRETIKCSIISTTKNDMYKLAMIENIQRDQLHPIELALSFQKALEEKIYPNAKALAIAMKKSESFITKTRNLLKLPKSITDDILKNKRPVSIETLSLIRQIGDGSIQLDIYQKYISGNINRNGITQIIKTNKAEDKLYADPVSFKTSKEYLNIKIDWNDLEKKQKDDLKKQINKVIQKYITDEKE